MNEMVLSGQPQALTIQQVVDQRELVVSAMKNAMTEGTHYGKIPGCGDKPTLMQPGAQILGHLFKLRPEYEIKEKAGEGEHREYQIVARQFLIGTEMQVGEGVGICSTRESKYRYRNAAKEVTWLDEPVPKVYWNLRSDPAKLKEWMETVFEGKDVSHIGTKKNESQQWMFVEFHGGEGKVENENIADVFNTVLKMAKKRAYVDSIITATASSDLFTQDLEEIAENLRAVQEVNASKVTAADAGTENNFGASQSNRSPSQDAQRAEDRNETADLRKSAIGESSHTNDFKPQNPRGTSAPPVANGWQDVVCHIGKANGPLKDKHLGKLAASSLEWLETQMAKATKPTKQDLILTAALAMWRGSQGKQAEMPLGTQNRDTLKAKCEALKIPLAVITTVSRTYGGKSQTFDEIPDDEAEYMLDQWEETANLIKDEMDTLG